jgi:transposase
MPTPTRETSKATANKGARHSRDFPAMEVRRLRAAELFAKGVSQADIAREVSVSHQTVSDWHQKWRAGGKQALKAAGHAGQPPKVTEAQLAKVERALERGPTANGFSTELWTLARVAEVIEVTTGVRYHRARLAGAAPGGLEPTAPRPSHRTRRRGIERWVNGRWPSVKNNAGPRTPGSSY